MPIKLGIVMDPISRINIKKDTSFAMLLEAQARGWELHYMELGDLYLRNGISQRPYSGHWRCTRDENQWFRVSCRAGNAAGMPLMPS